MKLTKKEFEQKYRRMTISELAKELAVSRQTITNYCRRLGIPLKGKGNRMANRNVPKKIIIVE